MNYNFVVIEGNIGAGKTTLSTKIAMEYNAKLILEQFADNPFLPKFYNDPERFSFPLEMSFLADRYNQLKKDLAERDLFKTFTIADYFFMKSLIFAQSTLKEDEYKLYSSIFHIIYNQLPKPDLYVYLHQNVENLLENIKTRGRDYEKPITAEYLLGIQRGYFDFFKQQKNMRILVIDVNKNNFADHETDYSIIKKKILNTDYQKGITRIIL